MTEIPYCLIRKNDRSALTQKKRPPGSCSISAVLAWVSKDFGGVTLWGSVMGE